MNSGDFFAAMVLKKMDNDADKEKAALRAQLTEATAQVAVLREAAIQEFNNDTTHMECRLCRALWKKTETEEHIFDCPLCNPSPAAEAMVKALEFYANADRYDYDETCCRTEDNPGYYESEADILGDGGARARKALRAIQGKENGNG